MRNGRTANTRGYGGRPPGDNSLELTGRELRV
jgi:hypothetical protein